MLGGRYYPMGVLTPVYPIDEYVSVWLCLKWHIFLWPFDKAFGAKFDRLNSEEAQKAISFCL